MYHWEERYQFECPTGRFVCGENYEFERRGYHVNVMYKGSVSTKKADKTADLFCGVHSGGTNKGELLYFALMSGEYASSPDAGKALQKLWSGKTNKLRGISRIVNTGKVRV
jgi:hypothetical protein